ncbi:MAG: VOC family protein [Pacificimonas sp.]
MARITGIGGVFVKTKDIAARKEWYEKHLGLSGEYGANLRYRDDSSEAFCVVSSFPESTDYFDPSPHGVMVNFRVEDLDAFQAKLEAEGIEILDRQDEVYGKFAWIMDPDGVKLELWEQLGPAPE